MIQTQIPIARKHQRLNLPLDNPVLEYWRPFYTIKAGPYTLKLQHQTNIMGIINVTPDSFSQDGCLKKKGETLTHVESTAQKHVQEGADILDIGGESTRPGAKRIDTKEEIRRVIPVIKHLTKIVRVPISIDTYKTDVAKHALDAGAVMVNNIMGVKTQKSLLRMIRRYNAAIVLMHIKGTPQTMQKSTHYANLIKEIIQSLRASIQNCLENGIRSDKIIIDPGIGFGKSIEHNLEIINRLSEFHALNCPILIGTSRKSFIGKTLNKEVHERLNGSIASLCAGIINGAHIVRVHDVMASKEAATMIDAIMNKGQKNQYDI